MMVVKGNLYAVLALAITLSFLLQVPDAYSAKLSVEEKALSIITDVARLDMTKYNINASYHTFDQFGGVAREYLSQILEANGNKLLVYITFVNGTLTGYELRRFEDSEFLPLYAQPLPLSPLDAVQGFLQRYQDYSNAPIVQEAFNLLNSVSELKTMNKTAGNLKMRILAMRDSTMIDWVHTLNGLDFPVGLSVRIRNGILDSFHDESSLYRVGSADINISREEAVRIAWERAKTRTTLNISLGNTYEIVPFRLLEKPIAVQLQPGIKDFVWYPAWLVTFSADKTYYGVTGISVRVRADTGDVVLSYLAGYYGDVSDPNANTGNNDNLSENLVVPVATPTLEPSPETTMLQPSPELSSNAQSQPENTVHAPPTMYAVIAVIAAIALVAITVAIKKRSK